MNRFRTMIFAGLICTGTMTAAHAQSPVAGQPYQVPPGFTGYTAGTLITYGGFNYVIQDNGTMLLAADSAGSSGGADQPVTGQPYQVPADFSGSDAGTVIYYGGFNYVAQGDGTMLLQVSADSSSDSGAIADSGSSSSASASDGGAPISQTGFTDTSGGVSPAGIGTSVLSSANFVNTPGVTTSPWPYVGSTTPVSNSTFSSTGRVGTPWLSNRPTGSSAGFAHQPTTFAYHPGNHVAHPGGQVSRPNVSGYHPTVSTNRLPVSGYHPTIQVNHQPYHPTVQVNHQPYHPTVQMNRQPYHPTVQMNRQPSRPYTQSARPRMSGGYRPTMRRR
jgi:hypothetical protein